MSEIKRLIENESPEFAPSKEVKPTSSDELRNAAWEKTFDMILEEYDRLLWSGNRFQVEGVYYESEDEAHNKRMYAAERIAREKIHQRKQNLNSTFLPKELRVS